MTIRVVIADDHRVVRDGLCYLLSQEPDVEIVGEAGDGRQAVAVAAATRPDVLLLDTCLHMPGLDEPHAVIAALDGSARHRPAIVVLTSAATADDNLVSAMRAGATSYLLKTAFGRARHQLPSATPPLSAPPACSPELLTRLHPRRSAAHRPAGPAAAALSPREREVLSLIARGHGSNSDADRQGTW